MIGVLVNIGLFAPHGEYGGTSVYIFKVYKQLLSKGFKIHIIISNTNDELVPIKELQESGYVVHVVPMKFAMPGLLGTIEYFIRSTILSVKICKNENIDIIHANHIYEGISGLFSSYVIDKPLIITFHGEGNPGAVWELKKIIRYFVALKCTKIILLNKRQMSLFQNYGFTQKILQLPTGVDIDEFNKLEINRNKVKESLGISKDEKLILTISFLNQRKNVELLLNAFAIMSHDNDNCKLLVVGGGPSYDRLLKLSEQLNIRENVIFTGRVMGRGKIIQFLQSADVFVLTSLEEGLPLVVLEAMAAKLPVVTTPAGGLPELIKNNYNGILVDYDPLEVANAIKKVLDDAPFKGRLIENAYSCVSSEYSYDLIALNLETLYRSVIDEETL